jgi:hypothetical protein
MIYYTLLVAFDGDPPAVNGSTVVALATNGGAYGASGRLVGVQFSDLFAERDELEDRLAAQRREGGTMGDIHELAMAAYVAEIAALKAELAAAKAEGERMRAALRKRADEAEDEMDRIHREEPNKRVGYGYQNGLRNGYLNALALLPPAAEPMSAAQRREGE